MNTALYVASLLRHCFWAKPESSGPRQPEGFADRVGDTPCGVCTHLCCRHSAPSAYRKLPLLKLLANILQE
ncbi:rCG40841 [Rattus norvegicus]|uniref:RCG40841 n=1 Tax=Rattus norvegicus TaxID=10116 RepID=A6KL03_RAT|nr:rCG40841 [Rattus norvegicus]